MPDFRSFAASLTIALLVGCGKPGAPATPAAASADGNRAVQVVLDWQPEPEFGGFYAAREGGAFSRHHLDVELKNAPEQATWQAVDRGNAKFATTSADQVLIARAHGADVVALFAVYQVSPQGVMVHKARGLTSLADVFSHGGTLAAEDNAWLSFCRNKYHATGAAPSIVGLGGGVTTWLRDPAASMQCFVTSEPIVAQAAGGDPQTFLVADAGFNPYVTVLIAKGETIDREPELAKDLVLASREGWRQYLDAPAAAHAAIFKLNDKMDPATLAKIDAAQTPLIETAETKSAGLGSMTLERWQTLGKQLVDLGVIPSAPDAAKCFRNF